MFKALDFRFIKHDYLLPAFATAIQTRNVSVGCGCRGAAEIIQYCMFLRIESENQVNVNIFF
jgi:hypothetical protein